MDHLAEFGACVLKQKIAISKQLAKALATLRTLQKQLLLAIRE